MTTATHKMLADGNLANKAKMSASNSAGVNCQVFFPFDEVIGATSLVDVSSNALAKTVTATTGSQPAPTLSDAISTPDSGVVPTGFATSTGILLFGMWDWADTNASVFSNVGIGSTGSEGLKISSNAIEIGDGATLRTTSFSGTALEAARDSSTAAMIVLKIPPIADGIRDAEIYFMDEVTDELIYLESLDISSLGTISLSNNLVFNLAATETYFYGLNVFTNGLPDTWQADLETMQREAYVNGRKALPANWVTLD